MRLKTRGFGVVCLWVVWIGVMGLQVVPGDAQAPACPVEGQLANVTTGLSISPVPMDFTDTNPLLVGLGSYIVNAQGGCNDCHTEPQFAPGGDPFAGEPEQINAAAFMAGGRAFGPFISRNITACENGLPAGLTREEFLTVMRTGADLKDGQTGPPATPILQVMPWTVYGNMSDCDLSAVYEYLRAIPAHAGCVPAGVTPAARN